MKKVLDQDISLDNPALAITVSSNIEVLLKALGASVELADVGEQMLHGGRKLALPPVLLRTLGNNPKKKTVLIYSHHDVQPALKKDGWDTEPF